MEADIISHDATGNFTRGAIDCDVHVTVPSMKALLPYLDAAWRDLILTRGIGGLELASYPPRAAITCRADWRAAASAYASPLTFGRG